MSHPLVLAAVTAVLKNLLENGLVDRGLTTALGGDTAISALPPDRMMTGPDEKAKLNLFLYQVQAKGLHPTSRHAPISGEAGAHGLPRSLEMQYLLTAYGVEDLQTEILLGYGLELFQENPLLTMEAIGTVLAAVSSQSGGRLVPPARAALRDPRLPQCFQRIKICPQTLQTDEMVSLWSAFQVSFRPSIVYHVSVELAEDEPSGEKGK